MRRLTDYGPDSIPDQPSPDDAAGPDGPCGRCGWPDGYLFPGHTGALCLVCFGDDLTAEAAAERRLERDAVIAGVLDSLHREMEAPFP